MPNFFSVLAAVLLASIADSLARAQDLGATPVFVLAAALPVPFFLGELLRVIRRKPEESSVQRVLLGLFLASPLGIYAGMLFGAGWASFARFHEPAALESVRFLLLFAPYLLLKISQDLAFSRLQAAHVPAPSQGLGAKVKLYLFALLPILLYLGVSDALNFFRETRILFASVGLARFGLTAFFFLVLVVALPLAARFLWVTTPLPAGPLRERLQALAARLRFRCREILLWKSKEGSVNAAILGLFPRFRHVILTEGLVNSLEPAEVEAVFGHEVGHALRHHVAAFFAYVLGTLLLFLALAERFLGENAWSIAIALVYLAALWLLLGALSRRFELEADLFGASACGDPMVFIEALEKVGAYSGRGRWHGSWRHFSVAQRVSFLLHEASDPAKLAKFQSRMRLARWGGWISLLVASGFYGSMLFQDLPADLAERDLRRGNFEQAFERIEPHRLESERTRALHTLAELGAGFRRDNPQNWQEKLLAHGWDLFHASRFAGAYYFFSLASLLEIGDARMGTIARACELLSRNEIDAFNEFMNEGEGQVLLADPEIVRVFYPGR